MTCPSPTASANDSSAVTSPSSVLEIGVHKVYALHALRWAIRVGKRWVLMSGPRGTGKTLLLATEFHRLNLQFPGMTQIWGRSDRTRLTEAVLRAFEEEVLGRGHPLHASQIRSHRSSYEYPNGSRIILQGLDDVERGKSIGADLIWINEPTEVGLERIEEIAASMRQTISNNCPIKLVIGDHNPAPPSHWTNKETLPLPDRLYPRVNDDGTRMGEWFTPEMYREVLAYNTSDQGKRFHRIQTFHPDNWGYWDWSRWTWHEPGLRYAQDVLGRYSGARRARYLEGRPAATENVVYPEFGDEHVIKPFPIPTTWPHFVGMDPGYDHPCAILWFALAPTGELFIVDELYRGGLSVQQHAEDIRARNAGRTVRTYYADPQHAFSKTAQSPKSIADQLRECGLSFQEWPRSTDVEAMVSAVRDRLKKNTLQVFSTCENTIGEFQSWSFKRNAKGEALAGDDQFEDRNNHAMDVVKGFIATNPCYTRGKVEIYDGGE